MYLYLYTDTYIYIYRAVFLQPSSCQAAWRCPFPFCWRYARPFIARHGCAAPGQTGALPVRIQYERPALL